MTSTHTETSKTPGLSFACNQNESLRETFTYENGELFWNKSHNNSYTGKKAGGIGHDGYIRLVWERKSYRLHSLIWIWHNGEIPNGFVIDHINQDKTDNRIENLRLATRRQNATNCKSRNDLPVGIGRSGSGFRVQVTRPDRSVFHKRCKTLEEAIEVNRTARQTFYGQFS
jgi:hypothetical protein